MPAGFTANLSPYALNRLREAVKRAHMKNWPARHITNEECDKMIEAIGPEVMEMHIKRFTDTGLMPKKLYLPITAAVKDAIDKRKLQT